MAMNIRHLYSPYAEIIYYPDSDDARALHETIIASMDDIQERVCEVLIKHNFSGADVCLAKTGEVLMTIERT